jgi:hypothetical protein
LEALRKSYNFQNRDFASPKYMGFIFFHDSSLKELLKSKIFRFFEPLVDFILNFRIFKGGLKTFKKLSLSLSVLRIYVKRELFLKVF